MLSAVVMTPVGVSAGSLIVAVLVACHATGSAGVAGVVVAETELGATMALETAMTVVAAIDREALVHMVNAIRCVP